MGEFSIQTFEESGRENGVRFWYAHEFMKSLGYDSWPSFQKVITKAMGSCAKLGLDPTESFIPETLIEEGKELMEEDAEPEVMDAGLIGAAQKVEHYEIAGYGTVRTYAEMLGNDQAARLLQQTLDEEGMTDKKLNALAMQCINLEAAQGGDGD